MIDLLTASPEEILAALKMDEKDMTDFVAGSRQMFPPTEGWPTENEPTTPKDVELRAREDS